MVRRNDEAETNVLGFFEAYQTISVRIVVQEHYPCFSSSHVGEISMKKQKSYKLSRKTRPSCKIVIYGFDKN